jgi:hypothetical protein
MMWLIHTVGFHVSLRGGFSPVSIVIISWAKTDGCSKLEQDRGSKSCSLVVSIVNGVQRVNCSSILEFWEEAMTSDQDAHTFIICRDRERCVGGKTGRDSPCETIPYCVY